MYPSPEMLRAARALLGLTQEAAAKECRVSPRTLVAVENGRGTLAGLHNVMGAYMAMGIGFSGSPDYQDQRVSMHHVTPPPPPLIPTE